MKPGKAKLKELTEDQKIKELNDIVGMCIREAGDSYAECGRALTKYLKKLDLVDYEKGEF